MQYDFKNKAILCERWEQMLHLKELAEAQGLKVALSPGKFQTHNCFQMNMVAYVNMPESYTLSMETLVPYTTFIAQHTPDVSQIVASINIH